MPRNGTTGVATQPINTRAVDGETIMADKWNSVTDDIYSIVSAPTPITQGGTGATTASAARTALDVYAKSETYTRGEVDGFRTTDQNAAKDASNLNAGTVPDARLPEYLRAKCKLITDWNDATANGWYMGEGTPNAPTPSVWYFGQVIVHNGNYLEQRVVAFNTSEFSARPTYKRWRMGGMWGGWQRVYDTAAEIQSIPEPWVTSGQYALVAGGEAVFTHGLGVVPGTFEALYVCIAANNGYSVGDIVGPYNVPGYAGAYFGCQVTADATNVRARFAQRPGALILDKSTGATVSDGAPAASWRLVLRAKK